MKSFLLLAPLLAVAPPAWSQSQPLAATGSTVRIAAVTALPSPLAAAERDGYRQAFASIRARDWETAAARLDALPDGLLTPFARAELFLARGSPRADPAAIVALIARAPELPQASLLARLALRNGAESVPAVVPQHEVTRLAGVSRRAAARAGRSDVPAADLATLLQPMLKEDRPGDAELTLAATVDELTPDARTEWQQRVAWAYYRAGDDLAARRVAADASRGTGEWAVHADWVAGLAAFRGHDYRAAADSFARVGTNSGDTEMKAAGLYWTARADMAAGRPERVQPGLRTAARLDETFYGLLAAASLGKAIPSAGPAPAATAAGALLAARPNVRVAVALASLGEDAYADTVLRHQAAIGVRNEHEALVGLAAALDLPSTEVWLAQHGPAGLRLSSAARFPTPGWAPQGGWRIDRSLVFAHALQESGFRRDAVSHTGARGLMQLMPGTAALVARHRGQPVGALTDPRVNLDYGQSYLEELRDMSFTGGLLPKVIAAYNAGPGALGKWPSRDRGDPLLYIESIPYIETRAYVAIVLRNYWMYAQGTGKAAPSLSALAQGMWPKFPGLPGKAAVRLNSLGGLARAD